MKASYSIDTYWAQIRPIVSPYWPIYVLLSTNSTHYTVHTHYSTSKIMDCFFVILLVPKDLAKLLRLIPRANTEFVSPLILLFCCICSLSRAPIYFFFDEKKIRFLFAFFMQYFHELWQKKKKNHIQASMGNFFIFWN